MKAHPGVANVQEQACGALNNICWTQWGHGTMILGDISVSFAENLRQDYQTFSDVK